MTTRVFFFHLVLRVYSFPVFFPLSLAPRIQFFSLLLPFLVFLFPFSSFYFFMPFFFVIFQSVVSGPHDLCCIRPTTGAPHKAPIGIFILLIFLEMEFLQ